MKRIAFAAALMVLTNAGAAAAQDARAAEAGAMVEDLRAAVAARQNAMDIRAAEVRAAEVDDLRRAVAATQAAGGVAGDFVLTELRTANGLTYAVAPRGATVRTLSSDPVSYSISGRLPEGGSSTSLPVEIVAALRSDSHLKQMNVGSSPVAVIEEVRLRELVRAAEGAAAEDDRPSFNAAFGFDTLDEFHAWYSAQGAALHRAIDQAGAEDVRFNLSVVPAE